MSIYKQIDLEMDTAKKIRPMTQQELEAFSAPAERRRAIPGVDFVTVKHKNVAETDPHGTDPHSPGAKLDAGKNRLGLVLGGFAKALEEVGKVGTYGAEKYSPDGWKHVPNSAERYDNAMMRHWFAQRTDAQTDSATGLMHQAQVAWNALAVLELMLERFDG